MAQASITVPSIDQIVSKVITWLHYLVGLALIVILAATLARHFGLNLPIRTMGHTELLYLAGAYALMTGRIKFG